MKKRLLISTLGLMALVLAQSDLRAAPIDPITELGAANPNNWAVLEIGFGQSINISNPQGFVDAHFAANAIGIEGGGSINDGGTPVAGNVVLGGYTGGSGNNAPATAQLNGITSSQLVTYGSQASYQNSLVYKAVAAAQNASSYYAGLSATSTRTSLGNSDLGTTLDAGVYNLSGGLSLNGLGNITLHPNQIYVFNIPSSANFHIQGGANIIDSTPDDVLFNFENGSNGPSFTGGNSSTALIDGLILAPYSPVQLAPGDVNGEIIAGGQIQIVSGSQVSEVQGFGTVPDGASTMLLLICPLCLLFALKSRFFSKFLVSEA